MESTCKVCGRDATETLYVLAEYTHEHTHLLWVEQVGPSRYVALQVPVCATCSTRQQRRHRRTRTIAFVAMGGLGIASLYFIGALARLPTWFVLAALFGGGAVTAASFMAVYVLQRAAGTAFRTGGGVLRVVTTDRAELDRAIDKHELQSLAIINARQRGDAAELPAARIATRPPSGG